jgi:hypothetical protein
MAKQHHATHGTSVPKKDHDIAPVNLERNNDSIATSAGPHNGAA